MTDLSLTLPLAGGQARPPMRRCIKCKEAKPLDQFEKKEYGRKRTTCQDCANKRSRQDYADKPSRKESLRAWDNRNREKKRAYGRSSYERSRGDLERTLRKTISGLKARCKERLECTIVVEDVLALFERQGGSCALTGLPLVWGSASGSSKGGDLHPDTLSIDRVDQSQGYLISNIRLVGFQANAARGMYSDERLFAFCGAVIANRWMRA